MTQTIIAPHDRTVRFWGLGGGGINVVRQYREGVELLRNVKLSKELYSLVDTSLSNLQGANADDVYTIRNVDGSGGNPAKNAEKIAASLPDIIEKNPPGDTNVVVFSNGGGSGSAIAPQLIRYLLENGYPVVAIMIGMTAAESLRTVRNCVVTVKNLELAVKSAERPLAIVYAPLDPEKSYIDNNVLPLFAMTSLSILCSGHNPRMDKADIDNFLDYHLVTTQQPALSILKVSANKVNVTEKVTGYLALMNSENVPAPRVPSDYAKHGLTHQESAGENSYFYTITANLGQVYDDLTEMEKTVNQRKTVKVERQDLVKGEVKVDTATGMIFD